MVEDKTNKIYNDLSIYMKSLYPNLKTGQNYNENDVKIPYMYFYLLDAPTALDDLSNNEVGVKLAFQIETYTDGNMNQARKMASEIRSFMRTLGFRCITFRPIETPTNVKRFVARYERLDV